MQSDAESAGSTGSDLKVGREPQPAVWSSGSAKAACPAHTAAALQSAGTSGRANMVGAADEAQSQQPGGAERMTARPSARAELKE